MELCVQRRTALDLIGEGVPDWEDENIEQALALGRFWHGEKIRGPKILDDFYGPEDLKMSEKPGWNLMGFRSCYFNYFFR